MENKTVLKGGLSIDWDFGHVFKFSYSYFDHIKICKILHEYFTFTNYVNRLY